MAYINHGGGYILHPQFGEAIAKGRQSGESMPNKEEGVERIDEFCGRHLNAARPSKWLESDVVLFGH